MTRLVHLIPATTSSNLTAVLSPSSNGVALFTTSSSTATTTNEPVVYFAQYDHSELGRRSFITSTYLLFSSLKKIALEAKTENAMGYTPLNAGGEVITPEALQYFNRISCLYRAAITDHLVTVENQVERNQYFVLTAILALTEILYLPSDGRGDGIVGEEMMDWVNRVDPSPSTDEGSQLAELERSWEHPDFWSYIHRSILRARLTAPAAFLTHLGSHPSPVIQALSALAVEILQSFPRSTAFKDERTFLASLREWRMRAQKASLRAEEMYDEAERDPVIGDDEEKRAEWEAGFRGIFELCEGKEKRILEVSEDWKEALAAWLIWVNVRARRKDLPATLTLLLKHFPTDQTLPSEAIQSSLVLGDVARALQQANIMSNWLSAHLADLLSQVNVVEPDFESMVKSPISPRNYFVLSYVDQLLSDSSLWRIAISYLSTCGDEGRSRMRRLIMTIPLEIEMEGAMEIQEQANGDTSIVEDVLRVCAEHEMRAEEIMVCQIYTEQLVRRKEYGIAISYCVRAADSKRIARIAQLILEEYIAQGQEAFIRYVDSIPTSLLRSSAPMESRSGSPTEEDDEVNEYLGQVSFLARYREFLALYAKGERRRAAELLVLMLTSKAAPKRFWAVLLLDAVPLLESEEMLISTNDCYELLRCMEEVISPIVTSQQDVHLNLDVVARIFNRSSYESDTIEDRREKALKQTHLFRFSMANYLTRCFCA